MSEATPGDEPEHVEDSYGELLGEYFSVAADIATMLDEHGHPDTDRRGEYDELRERKHTLRSAIETEAPDHDTAEIEAVLDEAFSEPRS